MVGLMFERICTKGETIIEQGAPGDNFYVLEQGKVSVAVNDKQVATLEPGASFGELALMYNSPRAATIVAEGKCTLWAMTRQTFRKKVNNAAAAKRDKYKKFLKGVALLQNIEDYERNQVAHCPSCFPARLLHLPALIAPSGVADRGRAHRVRLCGRRHNHCAGRRGRRHVYPSGGGGKGADQGGEGPPERWRRQDVQARRLLRRARPHDRL